MEVIKKGRPQKGWSIEVECTGRGNGGGGCGALLLVSVGDLYKTYSHARDESTEYITFTCSECSVRTDIKDVPSNICKEVRSKETSDR